ncbi:MAG: ribosome maturation factor RimM [Proteobacteria bacterium]|nr:ribosome maturation factor RimM [Pseudomonadota bacterium]
MARTAWFRLGRIVGGHGLRGLVKVRSDAESVDSFLAAGRVRVGRTAQASTGFFVRRATPQKRHVLLELEGVTGADQVEKMRGLDVFVARDDLPPLEEGEYYWEDLLGLPVVDEAGRRIGRLWRIMDTGAHQVFVVRPDPDSEEGEVLIPVIDRYVPEIDPTAGRIVVRVPEFF